VKDRAVNGTASAPLAGRRRLYAARPYLNSAFTRPSEAGETAGSAPMLMRGPYMPGRKNVATARNVHSGYGMFSRGFS
jgi:hypothetical protein